MAEDEKKLLQAKHRLEEAEARNRVRERKARARRLIQEGAVLEKVLPEVVTVELEKLDKDIFIEYVYVFGLDNKWRYFEGGSFKETGLMSVEKGLSDEYKNLGFERPKDVYGYFTEKDIEYYKDLQNKKDAVM